MRKVFIVIIGFAILFGLEGCEKFLTVYPPADQMSNEQVFSSKKDIEGAIGGVYYKLTDLGSFSYYNSMINGLYTDELQMGSNAEDANKAYELSYLNEDNDRVLYIWQKLYATIYAVNIVIEGITNNSILSEKEQQQYTGEMLTLRAYCYMELAVKFGGVPIVKHTIYKENASIPRSTLSATYEFIENDLLEAVAALKADDEVKGFRADVWTAKSLLARLYWFLGAEAQALQQANDIIDLGGFGPLPALRDVYLENSSETIWALDIQNESYLVTQEAVNFLPYDLASIPSFVLSEGLVQSFELNDLRLNAWTGYNNIDGVNYYYPAKYINTNSSVAVDFVSMIRLSEIYLLRADAKAGLNDLDGAVADLNIVRSRAGLPNYETTVALVEKTALLKAIMEERRHECFLENGIRWMDLKRSNTADAVLSQLKPATWQEKGLLWPIPAKEIDLNPFLNPNESNEQ